MYIVMTTGTLLVTIEPQKPNNVTAVMPLIHNSYDTADVLNITLEWDDKSNPLPLKRRNHIFNYTVTVQCSEAADSESVIFYTELLIHPYHLLCTMIGITTSVWWPVTVLGIVHQLKFISD